MTEELQRGHQSDVGPNENPTMVIMDKEMTKVIAVNSDQSPHHQRMSIQSNGGNVNVEIPVVKDKLVEVVPENLLKEKTIYMISITTILLLCYSLVTFHWILPYYYTVLAPILLFIRVLQYWSNNWQYYLIDFCYFANIVLIIYIWALPNNEYLFTILFGLANGPLTWAVVLFRNSVVFHSTDKMTSTFIHVLPPYLLYCIRWYPKITSEYWYTAFIDDFDENVNFMFLWLVAVPFGCFVLHSLVYLVLVYCIFRPGEDYDTSFKHISTRTSFKVCTGALGPKHHFLMYNIFNYLYCIVSLMFTPLWYVSFAAHSAYLAAATFGAFWNGASYYLEVFGRRSVKKKASKT